MNPDELQELKELVEFLKENKIGEFDLERGELKVRIKFAAEQGSAGAAPMDLAQLGRLLAAAPSSAGLSALSPANAAAAPEAGSGSGAASAIPEAAEEVGLHTVKSPIVGTFYESSSPGSPPFVKPGDQVELGQVLGIIEAMKLMNEIESDAAGEVVQRIVGNGQPVEYGQALFTIRPK